MLRWFRQRTLIRAAKMGTSLSTDMLVIQGQGTSRGMSYQWVFTSPSEIINGGPTGYGSRLLIRGGFIGLIYKALSMYIV